MSPDVNIPNGASEEELRARLLDGSILCGIIKKFNLGCSKEVGSLLPMLSDFSYLLFIVVEFYFLLFCVQIVSTDNQLEKIRTFIEVVEQMRLPSFKIEDLEQVEESRLLH